MKTITYWFNVSTLSGLNVQCLLPPPSRQGLFLPMLILPHIIVSHIHIQGRKFDFSERSTLKGANSGYSLQEFMHYVCSHHDTQIELPNNAYQPSQQLRHVHREKASPPPPKKKKVKSSWPNQNHDSTHTKRKATSRWMAISEMSMCIKHTVDEFYTIIYM